MEILLIHEVVCALACASWICWALISTPLPHSWAHSCSISEVSPTTPADLKIKLGIDVWPLLGQLSLFLFSQLHVVSFFSWMERSRWPKSNVLHRNKRMSRPCSLQKQAVHLGACFLERQLEQLWSLILEFLVLSPHVVQLRLVVLRSKPLYFSKCFLFLKLVWIGAHYYDYKVYDWITISIGPSVLLSQFEIPIRPNSTSSEFLSFYSHTFLYQTSKFCYLFLSINLLLKSMQIA